MKTRERTKSEAEEPQWYATPGELAKAEPDDLAGVDSDESPDKELHRKKKQRAFAVVYAGFAALLLATGETFEAMFWTAFALYMALEGETRWRVPKLVKYSAFAVFMALAIFKLVTFILKLGGH